MGRKWWLYASVGGMALSLITLFLPIVQYSSISNDHYSYNLISFIADADGFLNQTLVEYTGKFMGNATDAQINALIVLISLIGLAALVLSTVGILTLSWQKPNTWPFVLALLGLIFTAIPALSLLIMYALSSRFFMGELSIGAYAIVTPIAMVCAMIAVTYKHRANREERAAAQYWHVPGSES